MDVLHGVYGLPQDLCRGCGRTDSNGWQVGRGPMQPTVMIAKPIAGQFLHGSVIRPSFIACGEVHD